MTISSSTLKLLMDAGLEGEDLLRVVESMENDTRDAKPKSSAAVRQQRYRDRKNNDNVTCDVTRYVTDKGTLDNEGFPHTPSQEINPPKEKTPKGVQKKSPKLILESVLSEPLARAVLDHRQRIRKPLTDRAAELLAAKFAKAPDVGFSPDQAADLMIARGWQGFELDWARNCSPQSAPVSSDAFKAGTMMKSPDGKTFVPTTESRWGQRVSAWRSGTEWSVVEWGPAPGQAGCNVPSKFLQQDRSAA